MGKAKRKLNEARKAYFSEISKEDRISDDDRDDIEGDIEGDPEDRRLLYTAFDIRMSLFQYVEENSYPLCEYLDLESVIQYVKWAVGE